MPISIITALDFEPRSFAEAEKHFRKKVPLTHGEFDRLARDEKAKGFRISQVHSARMVQLIRNKLAEAIAEGKTYREWRREILPLFEEAQIPPPALSSLRLAYFQNTSGAYSDARAETLTESRGSFPYWQYKTVGNGVAGYLNVRASHAALHDKVFLADDPIWNTHRPPWDYGCRCTWVELTANQVASQGLTIWTYSGGFVVPAAQQLSAEGGKGAQPFASAPSARYSTARGELNLAGLDADLRQAIEERLS